MGEAHSQWPVTSLLKDVCILSYHSCTTACWRNLLRPVSFMHHHQHSCAAACWEHLGPGGRLPQLNRSLDPLRSSARGTVLSSVCRAALSSCMCQFGRGAFLSQSLFFVGLNAEHLFTDPLGMSPPMWSAWPSLSNLGSFFPPNQ